MNNEVTEDQLITNLVSLFNGLLRNQNLAEGAATAAARNQLERFDLLGLIFDITRGNKTLLGNKDLTLGAVLAPYQDSQGLQAMTIQYAWALKEGGGIWAFQKNIVPQIVQVFLNSPYSVIIYGHPHNNNPLTLDISALVKRALKKQEALKGLPVQVIRQVVNYVGFDRRQPAPATASTPKLIH